MNLEFNEPEINKDEIIYKNYIDKLKLKKEVNKIKQKAAYEKRKAECKTYYIKKGYSSKVKPMPSKEEILEQLKPKPRIYKNDKLKAENLELKLLIDKLIKENEKLKI